MSLLNSKEGIKIVEQITLKNVKDGFGHDLAGMYADFYLKGEKLGYYNDDGWGGEVEIKFVSETAQKRMEAFLKENKVAKIMFDNGWGFMKSVNRIDLHCQTVEVIDEAYNLIQRKKAQEKYNKQLQKICLNAIVVGSDTDTAYRYTKFSYPLKTIVEMRGKEGVRFLQTQYNIVRMSMKRGEKILNTNLEELGIKLV